MYKDILHSRIETLRNEIAVLQSKISVLPEGDLLCARNGHYIKCYLSNGRNPIYISKKQRHLAESLALKKYYQAQLADLNDEITFLTHYQKNHGSTDSNLTALLDPSSIYSPLLASCLKQQTTAPPEWAAAPFPANPSHPEALIHNTLSGHLVRSKSEVIIANTLFLHQIPYRYECALSFEHCTIFPDFTILHPLTNELLYWEHFGMMDDDSYRNRTYDKLRLYGSQGLIPSINLITSYETQAHPINSRQIEMLIQEYLM